MSILNVPELYGRFMKEREFLRNLARKTLLFHRQAWNCYRPFLEVATSEAELRLRPASAAAVLLRLAGAGSGRGRLAVTGIALRAFKFFGEELQLIRTQLLAWG